MSTALKEKPEAEVLSATNAASTYLNGRYMPPPADGDGKTWVRTSALVQAPAEKLFALWSDVESIPLWQEEMVQVRSTGPKTSHWIMRHGEKTVEWDAEVANAVPGKLISWKSIGGDVHEAGEVTFEPAPGGRGTFVTLLQEYSIGKLASMAATLTGRNPKQAAIENLRHFKALAETGEIPRVQPQPHGDRGTMGNLSRKTFGETIPVPPGTTAEAL